MAKERGLKALADKKSMTEVKVTKGEKSKTELFTSQANMLQC